MSIAQWIMAVTPAPDPNFEPTRVAPTWVGFAVAFLGAVARLFLIMDVLRRVRSRSEVLEKLEAERAAEDRADMDGGDRDHRIDEGGPRG